MILAGVLDPLVQRIETLTADTTSRVIIGIAGMPGAGKSTLALALVDALAGGEEWRGSRVAYLPMDGFHLANAELRRLGLADRKGAPQTFDADGYAALLTRVAAGETVWAPEFDRGIEEPVAQSLPISASTRIVITEGNYLLVDEPPWVAARRRMAQTWYVRIDDATRLKRLVDRHIAFGKSPAAAEKWVLRSDQRNAEIVAAHAFRADLTVDL